jgi:hypothetical protein
MERWNGNRPVSGGIFKCIRVNMKYAAVRHLLTPQFLSACINARCDDADGLSRLLVLGGLAGTAAVFRIAR